jgi:hypothetical protein
MANSQFDLIKNTPIDDVVKTAAGTVTNDVRVVLKEGLTKEEAYNTLTAIRDAIQAGRIVLE